jgi:hypothetical protein
MRYLPLLLLAACSSSSGEATDMAAVPHDLRRVLDFGEPAVCNNDFDCHGARVCVSGHCADATSDMASGCAGDFDCKGSRICVAAQCANPVDMATTQDLASQPDLVIHSADLLTTDQAHACYQLGAGCGSGADCCNDPRAGMASTCGTNNSGNATCCIPNGFPRDCHNDSECCTGTCMANGQCCLGANTQCNDAPSTCCPGLRCAVLQGAVWSCMP